MLWPYWLQTREILCKELWSKFVMEVLSAFTCFQNSITNSPSMGRRAPVETVADQLEAASTNEANGDASAEPRPLATAQKLAASLASSNEVAPDLFGREAKHFTETRVCIVLEGVDKFINLIGSVYYPDGDSAKDLALDLVEHGLAKFVEWSANMMEDAKRTLKTAEHKAKKDHLRIWTNYIPPVVEVVSGDCIIVDDNTVPFGRPLAERRINLSSIRSPKLGNPCRDEPAPSINNCTQNQPRGTSAVVFRDRVQWRFGSNSGVKNQSREAVEDMDSIGKFLTLVTHRELEAKVNETKAMVKFQLKKVLCKVVDVGNLGMKEKQIFQNYLMLLTLLVQPTLKPPISDLGPDALLESMTTDEFFQLLRKKKIIEPLLLDQNSICITAKGNLVAQTKTLDTTTWKSFSGKEHTDTLNMRSAENFKWDFAKDFSECNNRRCRNLPELQPAAMF
ncbi:hypothetical protein C5167_014593 [Papaver somniferum]|uniref:TNase-like domain-containing protein n=1 Tax=Papaver somniferum TaxID=3469 RepID=A0A4Y7J6S1_PAPSO|nr:hypothetical protein C5167_014593 [Papaver somniferum]